MKTRRTIHTLAHHQASSPLFAPPARSIWRLLPGAALASAVLCVANVASADQVGIGIQFGQWGMSNYPYNWVPGWQVVSSGTLTDGRVYSSPNQAGSSNATAGFGALSLSLQQTTIVPPTSLSQPMISSYAYFADTVTIDAPGLTGQSGSLTYSFTLDGLLSASGAPGINQTVGFDLGWGSDAGDGIIPNSIDTSFASSVGLRSHSGYSYSFDGLILGAERTNTINFTYGQPFDFWLVVRGTTSVYTGYQGAVSGSLSLVDWSGFENITAGGSPVTNATLVSSSGTDWTQPVPEPSTGLLLLAGMGLILRRRR